MDDDEKKWLMLRRKAEEVLVKIDKELDDRFHHRGETGYPTRQELKKQVLKELKEIADQ